MPLITSTLSTRPVLGRTLGSVGEGGQPGALPGSSSFCIGAGAHVVDSRARSRAEEPPKPFRHRSTPTCVPIPSRKNSASSSASSSLCPSTPSTHGSASSSSGAIHTTSTSTLCETATKVRLQAGPGGARQGPSDSYPHTYLHTLPPPPPRCPVSSGTCFRGCTV